MSKIVKSNKKTVKIKESHLVDLIDNIVNEAVAIKKQEWINENANKGANKSSLLENRIAELEAKINKLTSKK